MMNKTVLTILALITPVLLIAQEQMTAPEPETGNNVVIYIIIAILLLGIIGVYAILSRRIDTLEDKLRVSRDKINDLAAPMWDGKIEKFDARIRQLEEVVNNMETEKLHPVSDTIISEEPKEELPEQEPERQEEHIFYANYRPQDACFNLTNTEKADWLIWKITQVSPTEATYELADVSPGQYAEQWYKIQDIVKCTTPPSGNIAAATTLKKGRLVNKEGVWRVDPENKAEVEFKCE